MFDFPKSNPKEVEAHELSLPNLFLSLFTLSSIIIISSGGSGSGGGGGMHL